MGELLARLHAREDVLIGLATGKSRRGVDRLIAHHGWADWFVTTQSADDAPSKPDPTMLLQAMAEAGCPPRRPSWSATPPSTSAWACRPGPSPWGSAGAITRRGPLRGGGGHGGVERGRAGRAVVRGGASGFARFAVIAGVATRPRESHRSENAPHPGPLRSARDDGATSDEARRRTESSYLASMSDVTNEWLGEPGDGSDPIRCGRPAGMPSPPCPGGSTRRPASRGPGRVPADPRRPSGEHPRPQPAEPADPGTRREGRGRMGGPGHGDRSGQDAADPAGHTSIDGVAPRHAAVVEDLCAYAGTDLLAYRAGDPERLVSAQAASWDRSSTGRGRRSGPGSSSARA